MIDNADVVIVGSGMSGASLAHKLSERTPAEISLVSAGRIGAAGEPPAWAEWSSRNAHYRPAPGVYGRIGGRSTAWYGVVLQLSDPVRKDWPEHIRTRFPELYYQAESRLAAWKGTALNAPTCPADLALTGLPSGSGDPFRVVPTAAYWHTGSPAPVWRAYSPVDQLLETRPAGLTVADGRRVLWVEEHGNHGFVVVSADEVTGEQFRIAAPTVVLAAGTLENTRIFAQSLERLAGVRILEWPGLTNKIKQGIFTRPAPWMLEAFRPGDMAYLVAEHPGAHANLFLELRDDQLGRPYVDLWWFAEQSPGERATITLSPDAMAWSGTVSCAMGSRDLDLVAGREALANQMLREWGCPEADLSRPAWPAKAAAQAAFADEPVHYRNWIGLSDHESGTIALGEHLDETGMSLLVDRLFVTGPATFPRIGAANPSLTILALADLAADVIGG